ncbi:MAG: class I SAM-dependent methyltransferase [Polyangiales bacterium]
MPKKGVDHELRIGSSAHYDDPEYYAHAYRDRTEDVGYYVDLAKRGPILEYGCGEGRIALPIARKHISIEGIDLSVPMLGSFRERLNLEPADVRARVKLHHGDMRTLRLKRKFPLVLCTFNTFLHLYTRDDVEAFLERVKAHLAPRGRFVFDVSIPVAADLARDPSRAYKLPAVRVKGRKYAYRERFDYEPVRQVLFVAMEFENEEGAFVTPLAHRQFFPQELEALLHYNGFRIEKLEGGFHGEPADRHSDSLIFTCVRRGRT